MIKNIIIVLLAIALGAMLVMPNLASQLTEVFGKLSTGLDTVGEAPAPAAEPAPAPAAPATTTTQ